MRSHASFQPMEAKFCAWGRIGSPIYSIDVIICAIFGKSAANGTYLVTKCLQLPRARANTTKWNNVAQKTVTWNCKFFQLCLQFGPFAFKLLGGAEVVEEVVKTQRTKPVLRLVISFQAQRYDMLPFVVCVLRLWTSTTICGINIPFTQVNSAWLSHRG